MGEKARELGGREWLDGGSGLCLAATAEPALAAVLLPYPKGPWNEAHLVAVAGETPGGGPAPDPAS